MVQNIVLVQFSLNYNFDIFDLKKKKPAISADPSSSNSTTLQENH